jgi:hypothetical protein
MVREEQPWTRCCWTRAFYLSRTCATPCLSIAEEGVFRPLCSEHVLAELRRNLLKAGAKQEAVDHRLAEMAAYFPDALVMGYEGLIDTMTNHPKDRHVLAAAVVGCIRTRS